MADPRAPEPRRVYSRGLPLEGDDWVRMLTQKLESGVIAQAEFDHLMSIRQQQTPPAHPPPQDALGAGPAQQQQQSAPVGSTAHRIGSFLRRKISVLKERGSRAPPTPPSVSPSVGASSSGSGPLAAPTAVCPDDLPRSPILHELFAGAPDDRAASPARNQQHPSGSVDSRKHAGAAVPTTAAVGQHGGADCGTEALRERGGGPAEQGAPPDRADARGADSKEDLGYEYGDDPPANKPSPKGLRRLLSRTQPEGAIGVGTLRRASGSPREKASTDECCDGQSTDDVYAKLTMLEEK